MFIKEKIKSVVVDEFDRDGEHYYVVASAYKAADSSISADYKTIALIDCVQDEQRIPLGEEVDFDEYEVIKRLPIKFANGKRIGNIVNMFKLLASMPKEKIGKDNSTYFLTKDGKIPAGKDVLDQKLINQRFGRMLDVIEDIANDQGAVRLDREAFLKEKQPLINEVKDQKYEIENILQKPIDNWGDDLNHALDVYSVKCSYVLSYTAKIKKQQQKENMEEEQSLGL